MNDKDLKIGVVGGGRMGSGIAHAYLLAGNEVTVVEASPVAAEAARERILKLVQSSADRGALIGEVSEVISRFTLIPSHEEISHCDLVIEAIPEDPEMKSKLLEQIDSHLPEQSILASNTSSISIDQLASNLKHPERFLGMHFFNPVPASQLVEIVRGGRTSAAIVEGAKKSVSSIKKTPIIVGDSPGFASSRLGLVLGLEAIRMVEEGVASAEDIDTAMQLGYKHPVGPLKLTDIVGLDVRLAIAEYLYQSLGARFKPPTLLKKMVNEGRLGQKSGEGFYKWPN